MSVSELLKSRSPSKSLGTYETYEKFQRLFRSGDLIIPKVDFVEPLRTECEHFIECVKNGKKPLTDGKQGLKIVKILTYAQESLKKNGLPVEIKEKVTR